MPAYSNGGMLMKKKEIDKIAKEIETMNVVVIGYEIKKHLIFKIQNKDTGTIKTVSVSKSPKVKGIYHEIKSSVRKVFRKDGEQI
jgi:phage terminase small subunit